MPHLPYNMSSAEYTTTVSRDSHYPPIKSPRAIFVYGIDLTNSENAKKFFPLSFETKFFRACQSSHK